MALRCLRAGSIASEGQPLKVRHRVDELIHVKALGAKVVATTHDGVSYVGARYAIMNYCVDRIMFSACPLDSIDNARKLLVFAVHQVVEISPFLALSALYG